MDKQMLLAKKWFEFAEIDLELSEKLFEEKFEWDKWMNIICYHCQQSAEKFLKGFTILNKSKYEKIHDLVELYKNCERYVTVIWTDEDKEKFCDACINLSIYATSVRYPDYDKLKYDDIESAIEDAKCIKNFIKKNCEDCEDIESLFTS